MKRMISAERLARPDNFVLMTVRKMRAIREEQGLSGVMVPLNEETLHARLHTIYTGELQAMEAAGRTLFDFPDAPWEFQLDSQDFERCHRGFLLARDLTRMLSRGRTPSEVRRRLGRLIGYYSDPSYIHIAQPPMA
jgi:hypothetical protein